MANQRTQHYESMASIEELETTCQGDEAGFRKKLKSLKAAKNDAGAKVTVAVYEKDGLDGLGEVQIKAGGDQSAWIMTVNTKVSISR